MRIEESDKMRVDLRVVELARLTVKTERVSKDSVVPGDRGKDVPYVR